MLRAVMVSDVPRRSRPLHTARWVAASLALHVPLAPFTGLWALFERHATPAGGVASNVAAPSIPVELDAAALAVDADEAQPANDDASSSEATQAPRRPRHRRRAAKAMPAVPAPQRSVRAESGGGLGAAAAGEANAGVRLIVHLARAREQNTAQIGALLSAAFGVSGWQSFFENAGLDALRDLDRLLIAGASLRGGPGALAIFESNLQGDALKLALDKIVRESAQDGAWLTSALPLAQAQLAGNAQVFGLPNPSSLVSASLGDRAAVEGFAKESRIAAPTRDELASLYLAAPARSLSGVVDVPRRLHQARVFVKGGDGDGVRLEFSLLDDSAERAVEDARQLEQALVQLTGRQLGGSGVLANTRPFSGAHVHAAQQQVFGEIELSAKQTAAIAALLAAPH